MKHWGPGWGEFLLPLNVMLNWVMGIPQHHAKADPAADRDGEVMGRRQGAQAKDGVLHSPLIRALPQDH